MHASYGERQFHHLILRGEGRRVMFYSKLEFMTAMNCFALAAKKYDVGILAFVFLENHFHSVVEAARSTYSQFIQSFRISLTKNVNRLHCTQGRLGSENVTDSLIKDEADLRDAIGYCIRNPLHHGVTKDFYGYGMSSARLYYNRYPVAADLVLTDPKEIAKHLPMHCKLPDEYRMYRSGLILPQCYVDILTVESLFKDKTSFLMFLNEPTRRELRGEQSEDVVKAIVKHTDSDVIECVRQYCKDKFHKPFLRIVKKEEIFAMADYIRDNDLANSVVQISRILNVPINSLRYHFKCSKRG